MLLHSLSRQGDQQGHGIEPKVPDAARCLKLEAAQRQSGLKLRDSGDPHAPGGLGVELATEASTIPEDAEATCREARAELGAALAATASLETEAEPAALPSWSAIAVKVLVSAALFVLLSCGLNLIAGEHIASVSQGVMDRFGLPGLFVAMFLVEALPMPLPFIPLVFLAVQGGVSKPVVFGVCAAASYTAAVCGYGIGRCLRGCGSRGACFSRLTERYPQAPELMQKRGAVGVFLATLVPIPLSAAAWPAGFFGVSFAHFLVAAMGRFPKIGVYVLLSAGPDAVAS